MSLQKKASTARGKRALVNREPQIVEGVKKALFMKGAKTSEICKLALKDLYIMKKPDAKLFQKFNAIKPFEDASSIEFLCRQNDSSLFTIASHSKKRPHNLVMGRLFDFQVLDMFEFAIDPATFIPMSTYDERKTAVKYGSKPMMMFQGSEWEGNHDLSVLKNFFIDFFRGDVIEQINLVSLDRFLVFTVLKGKIYFRQYGVILRKSGTKLPRIELEEVGPHMDLTFKRRTEGVDAIRKEAMKVAKGNSKKPTLGKNVELSDLGDKMGRVHMHHQNLTKIAISKGLKALNKKRKTPHGGGEEAAAMEAAAAAASSGASSATAATTTTAAVASANTGGDKGRPAKKSRVDPTAST